MTEPTNCCDRVVAYLESVEGGTEVFDHEKVSAMIGGCPSCVARVADYFKVLEVPESGYLDETLDDLTLALYNLVKALMKRDEAREPAAGDAERRHGNVLFVDEPGDADEHAQDGDEMIDDVQDYVGRDEVRGASMEGIRRLIEESQARFEAAEVLLRKAAELDGRFSLDCLNLLGILHLERGENAEAEATFREIIRRGGGDLEARKVQVHAMNNLSFLCVARTDVDEAINWARRSRALAEETGIDPFASRFGLMYFYLRRNQAGDLERAIEEVKGLVEAPKSLDALRRCLLLATNAEIRNLVETSGLTERFPALAGS
ncbi:MAG: tetratricopeptide repeat protein [Planctomycetota bacterium]